jgi:hypothetical protein
MKTGPWPPAYSSRRNSIRFARQISATRFLTEYFLLSPALYEQEPEIIQPEAGMKRSALIGGVVTAFVISVPQLRASESASATVSLTSIVGSTYNYSITLHDTGTTNIGTLWYAWIASPFEDFLKSAPTSVTAPTGWLGPVENIGPSDGYSIEYYTPTPADELTPGNTLSGFAFSTPDSPSMLAGNSFYYPSTPVGTSFIYAGTPESDAGFEFVVTTVVPEPASLGMLILAASALGMRRPR